MRKIEPAQQRTPGYPQRDEGKADASRRRFLRQIAAGTGAAVVGLPRLSHAQGLEVDFDKLDGHPAVMGEADVDADRLIEEEVDLADGADAFAVIADEQAGAAGISAGAGAGPAEAEPTLAAEASDSDAAPQTIVEENRALWVEPGYLVLLKWRRPADDETSIAALEGAGPNVSGFLATRVTSVDDLHNLDRLHPIEHDLRAVLAALVAPAEIEVLHLDHDCTVVCSVLNPGTTYPDILQVDGGMAAPGWE